MKSLDRDAFETLVRGAGVLLTDRDGPKVFLTPEGEIVKLLRIKRLISSNLLLPHAERFARNAAKLAAAGIACPEVRMTARVPHLKRQMVVYRELPGTSLRSALGEAAGGAAAKLVHATGAFMAGLHERGVYFRSIHFGNILVTPDEPSFALIDFLDMKMMGAPLSLQRRIRNGKPIFRYREDRQALLDHWRDFGDGYHSNAKSFTQTARLLDEWRRMAGRTAGGLATGIENP
jgi:hypothetical protein